MLFFGNSKEVRHLFYHLSVCFAVFWFRFDRDNYFISIYLKSSGEIEFYFDGYVLVKSV